MFHPISKSNKCRRFLEEIEIFDDMHVNEIEVDQQPSTSRESCIDQSEFIQDNNSIQSQCIDS